MMTTLNRRAGWRLLASGLITFALLALPVSADTTASATTDLTLEQILENYTEARGGSEAWSGVKTMRVTASMTMNGQEIPMVVEVMRPESFLVSISMQGMNMQMGFDGENGWQQSPMTGDQPQKLPQAQLADMRAQTDFEGPLINHQDKGHKIQLVGKTDIEGTDAYHLKVSLDTGKDLDIYLDAEHFLDFRQEMTVDMNGTPLENVVNLGDYKEVDGLMIPFSYEVEAKNMPFSQTLTFDKVEVNIDLDADSFKMPEAAPAEGGE